MVNNRVKYDPGYLEKVPPHLKHKMSISKKTFVTEKSNLRYFLRFLSKSSFVLLNFCDVGAELVQPPLMQQGDDAGEFFFGGAQSNLRYFLRFVSKSSFVLLNFCDFGSVVT